MHFDILVSAHETNFEKVYEYGREYLKDKGQEGQPLTAKECRFCHIEQASPEISKAINERGFFIIEMENCS